MAKNDLDIAIETLDDIVWITREDGRIEEYFAKNPKALKQFVDNALGLVDFLPSFED